MIIADSTALIHLSRIGKLYLLQQLFTKVIVPEAVYDEVVIQGRSKNIANAEIIATQDWIIRKKLSEKHLDEAKSLYKNTPLGMGEAEAIIMAKAENTILLLDDKVGAKIAQSFGIETYWTTSVILKAAADKTITKDEAKNIIKELVRTGYHLKPEILLKIMEHLDSGQHTK